MPDPNRSNSRYRRIIRFALRHLVSAWWYEIALPSIGLRRIADRTRTRRLVRFARRYRALAINLGGLLIKMGQFLSSRLDVLPPEFTRELADLQDEVPPVAFDQIRALAESELGLSLESVYDAIDTTPVAAASLGQAYRARLRPLDAQVVGFADVVVKVQRPGIERIVAIDLAALRKVAAWLNRVRLVSRRANMPLIIEEFAQTVLQEIDYLIEGSHAEQFAANAAGDPRVGTPSVVWERTTRRVLTLQDVTSIKMTDAQALREAGIDPSEVAREFARIMFDQFFIHGFFHADPHPGNLFVTPTQGDNSEVPWTITFIDFGMMGDVPPVLRTTLRSLVIAAAGRDGRGIVRAMAEAGVLLPGADTRELEKVMSEVFARFGGMGLAELRELDPREFRDFALEFSDVLFSMPFQLPEKFLLLMRASSLTSGACSSLDPAYNLWDSVEPYAEQLLRDEGGNLLKDLAQQGWDAATTALALPRRIDTLITRIDDGDAEVRTPTLDATVARLERTVGRAISAIVFAGLLTSGAVLRPDQPTLGAALMIASALPALHAMLPRRRR